MKEYKVSIIKFILKEIKDIDFDKDGGQNVGIKMSLNNTVFFGKEDFLELLGKTYFCNKDGYIKIKDIECL